MSGTYFVYPPGGNFSEIAPSGTVNLLDTLDVSYTSLWSGLNLTLFCLVGDSTTNYQVWNAPENPLSPIGTYRLDSIDSVNFNILKFPAPCSFKLTNAANNDIARGGENFQVVSAQAVPTTYSSTSIMTSTSASSSISSHATTRTGSIESVSSPGIPATQADASSASSAAPAILSSTSSPSHSTNVHTAVSVSPTSSASASEPAAQAVGLSTGAKVGIGIGIVLLLLVIMALCFAVFRLRRKINKPTQVDLHKLQPELPAYAFSQDHKQAFQSNIHELDWSNRIKLPYQQAGTRPSELQ